MGDEDFAPSRAELEAWLWSYKKHKADPDLFEHDLTEYLKERGVSDQGIGKILSDAHTYSNYPVEEDSGENS